MKKMHFLGLRITNGIIIYLDFWHWIADLFNLPIIKVTLAALLASLFVLKSRNQQFGSHSFPLALRSQSRTPLGISIKPTILTTIVFEQGIKG